jgi:hypothetical protein
MPIGPVPSPAGTSSTAFHRNVSYASLPPTASSSEASSQAPATAPAETQAAAPKSPAQAPARTPRGIGVGSAPRDCVGWGIGTVAGISSPVGIAPSTAAAGHRSPTGRPCAIKPWHTAHPLSIVFKTIASPTTNHALGALLLPPEKPATSPSTCRPAPSAPDNSKGPCGH